MYRICPSGSSLAALTRSLDIFSTGGNRTSSSFGSMTVGIHLEYAAISSSHGAPLTKQHRWHPLPSVPRRRLDETHREPRNSFRPPRFCQDTVRSGSLG